MIIDDVTAMNIIIYKCNTFATFWAAADEKWPGSNRSIDGLDKLASPSGMKTRRKRVARERHFKTILKFYLLYTHHNILYVKYMHCTSQ